ncbi:MAG: hypothetical protein KIT63_24060 [Rhodoferax sp.]|nr:hypothetical protein [Rhodoferax sp.]
MNGSGGVVLYLDFDGVLHHENVLWHPRKGAYLSAPSRYVLFQHCELLQQELAAYPFVQIVLSTSWVRQYGFSRASKRLPMGLRNRVIGATWHSHMDKVLFEQESRGEQIWSDVQRRKPKGWIALDDDYERWPAHCLVNYVQTSATEGINDMLVLESLRTKLKDICS